MPSSSWPVSLGYSHFSCCVSSSRSLFSLSLLRISTSRYSIVILLLVLLIPLVTALLIALAPTGKASLHRTVALGGSIVAFAASLVLWFGFDSANPGFQFLTDTTWIASLDIGFRFGLDGMSLMLVLLTTFILPIAIYSSWRSITDRTKLYYVMLLVLESGLIGVFASLDTFVFYVFWEVILIPMYFLIGIWGGKDRIYAAMKFFLYTMAGSLLMLVAIIYLGNYAAQHAGGFTTDLRKLLVIAPTIPIEVQSWLFLAFALSFLIKVPIFPLHTWLPDAHTQAPTAGSVVLAAVMLKMGTYGLIRFNLGLFPQSALKYADAISVLAVVGIIYGALLAMVQTDIKKLVAYSSIAHLGFVTLGIFSMTAEGLQGAVIQMVNHGLSTGMLFLLIGFIYERRHTREMSELGGIAKSMPVYAVFFAIAMLSSVGLPGLNGFVGEYLTLIGAYISTALSTPWFAIIGASGVILAAVYLLILYQRIFFGPITNPANARLKDLSRGEIAMLVPIVVLCVWIGFQPNTFLRVSESGSRAVAGAISRLNGGSLYSAEVDRRLESIVGHAVGVRDTTAPATGATPPSAPGVEVPRGVARPMPGVVPGGK